MKAPRIAERLAATAERAREEQWPYEQFLETLCEAEVFAREASGARTRTRTAGFPAHKTLEDFDFTAQPSAERPLVMHLAQLAWIEEHANVCLIGPPGTGKSHLAIALGIKACQHGYRVAFATAQQWVSRLEEAQERNTLDQELRRLERYQLLIVDEVGYLPLERQAANLLFALVSRRYERGIIVSPATAALRPGARSSATRWSPPPSSTDSCTTPPWSPSKARATACANAAPPPPRLPDPRRSKSDPLRPAAPAASHSTRLRLAAREAAAQPSTGLVFDRRGVEHFSVPETGALFGSC